MSENITDINGNPLSSISFPLNESTESAVLVGLVRVAGPGLYLACRSDGGPAVVMARKTGSGDPFVDIAATPIDLTPYDGDTPAFDFKVVAEAVAASAPAALSVVVTPNP